LIQPGFISFALLEQFDLRRASSSILPSRPNTAPVFVFAGIWPQLQDCTICGYRFPGKSTKWLVLWACDFTITIISW